MQCAGVLVLVFLMSPFDKPEHLLLENQVPTMSLGVLARCTDLGVYPQVMNENEGEGVFHRILLITPSTFFFPITSIF